MAKCISAVATVVLSIGKIEGNSTSSAYITVGPLGRLWATGWFSQKGWKGEWCIEYCQSLDNGLVESAGRRRKGRMLAEQLFIDIVHVAQVRVGLEQQGPGLQIGESQRAHFGIDLLHHTHA